MLQFTTEAKEQFFHDMDIQIVDYRSGRLNDAPRQYRHIFREFQPGYYVVDNYNKFVYDHSIPPDMNEIDKINMVWNTVLAHMLAEEQGIVFYEVMGNKRPDVYDYRKGNLTATAFVRQHGYNRANGMYAANRKSVFGPYNNVDILINCLLQEFNYATIIAYGTDEQIDMYKVVSRIVHDPVTSEVVAIFFGEKGKDLMGRMELLTA